MKSKRITRKRVAVAIGLCLGWYLAGLAGPYLPFVGASVAEDSPTEKLREPAGYGDSEYGEAGKVSKNLVPGSRPAWLNDVLTVAGGLFVAAVLLGPIALALRGPERPDPADEHESAHDDQH